MAGVLNAVIKALHNEIKLKPPAFVTMVSPPLCCLHSEWATDKGPTLLSPASSTHNLVLSVSFCL